MRLANLVLVGILLAAAAPVRAEMCSDCRKGGPYTKDIGKCTHCEDGRTLSGQFKLCPRCSAKLRQCEHCLTSLAPATQPAAPATQPAAQIDPKNDGRYVAGDWEYRYTVTNKGTRSEGYVGELLHRGQPLAEPGTINDFHQTPWGPLYWVGQPHVLFGGHGWMPRPKPSLPAGKLLPDPAGEPAATQPGPDAAAARVDITQPGTYRSGDWEYQLIVTSPGSRSEGTIGKLLYRGKPVPEAAVGDSHRTPWGEIVWVGNPSKLWGEHGWVARPVIIGGVEKGSGEKGSAR